MWVGCAGSVLDLEEEEVKRKGRRNRTGRGREGVEQVEQEEGGVEVRGRKGGEREEEEGKGGRWSRRRQVLSHCKTD